MSMDTWDRRADIAGGLAATRARIEAACEAAGRLRSSRWVSRSVRRGGADGVASEGDR